MRVFCHLLLLSFLFISSLARSEELSDMEMPKGTLIMFAPPGVNKKYFDLEFGFLTEKNFKSWNYDTTPTLRPLFFKTHINAMIT